jgi:Na+-transporting methylmalonyl-CoA/oxaloacetate decarboxylase gamma subunit
MKNTEILKRINALLNRSVKLEQMTLDNGTVVEADSFTAGSPIFAINGENKDPLEVGTYTLADGTIIEVYEIGFIGEIAMPNAETEEVEAKKKKEEMAEVPATLEEILTAVVDAIQPKLDEMQAKIDALGGATTEMKATLSTEKARKPLTHKPAQKVELKSNSLDPQSMIFAKLANLKN